MVTARQVATSRAIQRRTGRTFHVATRLLPRQVRYPTYVLYAFFRIADEVVDDPGDASPATQRRRLEALREQALGRAPPEGPVLAAFQEVKAEHDIPDREVDAFVDAMCTDVEKRRYRTHAELSSYVRGSAAAVGLMMLSIMHPDDPDRAAPHAAALGEAFQLTNFLRDVREDVRERDRIYIPATTLERYGIPVERIERCEMSEAVARAIADELRRTEARYRYGVAGIRYLPRDCQPAVLTAAVLYAEYHRLIRERDYDVLSSAPSLGLPRALWIALRTRWRCRADDDPRAIFRELAAIGASDPAGRPGTAGRSRA